MKDHSSSSRKGMRMSVSDAAALLGVCPQTVRNLAHAGRIKWFWGAGCERPSGVVSDSVASFAACGKGRARRNVASR